MSIEQKLSLTADPSGARNLITRNGNGPFDLDYNIIMSFF